MTYADWLGSAYADMTFSQAVWSVNVSTFLRMLGSILLFVSYVAGITLACDNRPPVCIACQFDSACRNEKISVWGTTMPFSVFGGVAILYGAGVVCYFNRRIRRRAYLAQELQLALSPPCIVTADPVGLDITKFLPDVNAQVIYPKEIDLPYVFEVNAGTSNTAVHVATSFVSTARGVVSMTHVPLKNLQLERAALRLLLEVEGSPNPKPKHSSKPVAEAYGPIGDPAMIQSTSQGNTPPLICFWYPINAEAKWKAAGRAPTLAELHHWRPAEKGNGKIYDWVFLFGTHKLEGKFTENGRTLTTPTGVINFICFHTLTRLRELDFSLFVVNVDYTTVPRLWHPYTTKKRWPHFDECTWIGTKGEAERKKLLNKIDKQVGGICLPPERFHPYDVGCFELDVNWSLLGDLYTLKTIKWKPADELKGLFVAPSVNNGSDERSRQFGFDHMVRILPDFATVGTACCVSTTHETGPGGSSTLGWKKGGTGNKFELGMMHHGGRDGMAGFRNRATPPQPLLGLLRKHLTKELIVPPYSKAFTNNFDQMTQEYAKISQLEECGATPDVLDKLIEKGELFSGVFKSEDEGDCDVTCGDMSDYRLEVAGSKRSAKMKSSGRLNVSQRTWQKAVRALANKASKKSERQLHCVLYNALRDNIYFFDEAAFEKYVGDMDEEQVHDYIYGDEWAGLNVYYYGDDILDYAECVMPQQCLYSACTCDSGSSQRVIPSPMTVSLAVQIKLENPDYQIDYSQPDGCPDYPLDWFAAHDFVYPADDPSIDYLEPYIGFSEAMPAKAETVSEPFVDAQKTVIGQLNTATQQTDADIVYYKAELEKALAAKVTAEVERKRVEDELRLSKLKAQSIAFERTQANIALQERIHDPQSLEERGGSPDDGIRPPGFSLEPPSVDGGAGFNGHATHDQMSLKTRQELGLDACMSRNEPLPLATIHEAKQSEEQAAEIEGRESIPVLASQLPKATKTQKRAAAKRRAKAASAEPSSEPGLDVPEPSNPTSVTVDLATPAAGTPAVAETPAPAKATKTQRTATRRTVKTTPPSSKSGHAQCYLGNQHFRDVEASMLTFPGDRIEEEKQSLSFLRRIRGLTMRLGLSESVVQTPLRSINPEGDVLQFESEEAFGPQFERERLIPFRNYSERVFKKSGTGYNNGLNAIPPASRQSRANFNAVWTAFIQHAGGWQNMSMRTFGLYLDAAARTLDGHMCDSATFQAVMGNQLEYRAFQNVAQELPSYYDQTNFEAFEQQFELRSLQVSDDALAEPTKKILAAEAAEWQVNRRHPDGVLCSREAHRFRIPVEDPSGPASEVSAKFGGSSINEKRLVENGGLAFGQVKYVRNRQQKAWRHAQACTGWFKKWASRIWDPVTNRPTGALAASGPAAVLKSFSSQLNEKLQRVRAYSTNGHIEAFADGYIPTLWENNITLKDYLERVHRGVLASKSTAFGQQSGHQTKGEFMEDPAMLMSTVYGIFLTVATFHEVIETSTPKSLFEAGLLFPEEIFGKDEIHMNKKVDSDTLRCIWNTAVQMEIRTRFFHDRQNKTEIIAYGEDMTHSHNFPTFGSASGMGHCDKGGEATRGAMRRLMAFMMFTDFDAIENYGVGVDASRWDITVTRTLMMADAWRRAELARQGGAPYGFCCGIQNMGLLLSAHIVVIGQTLIEPRWFGMLGSGSPSTTGTNGFCRQYAHSELFWSEQGRIGLSLCMGDDCHSKDQIPEGFRALWQQLGINIKDSFKTVQRGEEVDFTSHRYNVDRDYFYFDNADKLLLRLAYEAEYVKEGKQPITREQAAGIQFAVRHNRHVDYMVRDYVASIDADYLVAHKDLCAVDVDLAGFF